MLKNDLNKAVYTAALVADGWAGAEKLEKQFCDRRTDRRTDGPADRKVAYRVACSRLKMDSKVSLSLTNPDSGI